MGSYWRTEPGQHERIGGKGQRTFWPLQSLGKHHQSILGPSSFSPPIYHERSLSVFSASLTCLHKLYRDKCVFQWKIIHCLHTTHTSGLSDSSPVPRLWVILCLFVLEVTERYAISVSSGSIQLFSLTLHGKISWPPFTYLFQYSQSRNISDFQFSFELVITPAWFPCWLLSKIKPWHVLILITVGESWHASTLKFQSVF